MRIEDEPDLRVPSRLSFDYRHPIERGQTAGLLRAYRPVT
jgi:hypothetical protein